LAAFHYWRGRHITYQHQGWLRIHRQNGGVALLYAADRWTRRIDELIWSGQRTAYVPGTRAWEQADVGMPVMLTAAFQGDIRATRDAYHRTLRHYRDEAKYRRAKLRTRRVWLICVARLASRGLADDETIRDALGT
jgi:hypothetical protein